MEIIITGADDGVFKMAMLKPGTEEFFKSGEITAGGNADQLRSAIKGFYSKLYGVNPVVTLTVFDADGAETTEDALDIAAHHYLIEVPLAISIPSVETIMVVPMSTQADILITYPSDKQLSSPPLSGKFYIDCYNTDGNKYSTRDIDVSSVSANRFKSVLESDCSFLAGKISVTMLTSTYSKKVMGVEFQINFQGIAAGLE